MYNSHIKARVVSVHAQPECHKHSTKRLIKRRHGSSQHKQNKPIEEREALKQSRPSVCLFIPADVIKLH